MNSIDFSNTLLTEHYLEELVILPAAAAFASSSLEGSGSGSNEEEEEDYKDFKDYPNPSV